MRKRNNIFIIISIFFIFFIYINCPFDTDEKLINNMRKEGNEKLDYLYNKIIKERKYYLLNDFLLKDMAIFYTNRGKNIIHEIEGSKEKFKIEMIKVHKQYGGLLEYKVINTRYSHALDEGTHNIFYKVEVKYKNVKTEEDVILGFKEKGEHVMKLIGYGSYPTNEVSEK
jgi:hypothetical protein